MPERTEALIHALASGLSPVRRLPGLGRVAANITGVAIGLVVAELAFAWAARSGFPKPGFSSIDAWTIAAHLLLGAGALAFALGACVPGRERLERIGALSAAAALAAVIWIGCERIAAWPGPAVLEPGWLGATLECSLGAIVPAALPALLLARFAARAAPRRVALALVVAAAAPLGLLTLPGILRCAYPDELHHVLGHLLTPAFGALALLVATLPVFLTARRSRRA